MSTDKNITEMTVEELNAEIEKLYPVLNAACDVYESVWATYQEAVHEKMRLTQIIELMEREIEIRNKIGKATVWIHSYGNSVGSRSVSITNALEMVKTAKQVITVKDDFDDYLTVRVYMIGESKFPQYFDLEQSHEDAYIAELIRDMAYEAEDFGLKWLPTKWEVIENLETLL